MTLPTDLALVHFVLMALVVLLLGAEEDKIHHPKRLKSVVLEWPRDV